MIRNKGERILQQARLFNSFFTDLLITESQAVDA